MNAKSNFTKARAALELVLAALLALATSAAPAAAQGVSFVQPLGTPLVSMTNGAGPVGMAAGDFDGDGILDLAVTLVDNLGSGQQGFVAVMRGKGDGTFEAPITLFTLPLNVFARGILAKDFDGDGKLDLVVAVGESRQILFFKGEGIPGMIMFDPPVVTNTTNRPQGLQTADLNGDGKLDLVTLNLEDNSVSVLLGVGNGTFQAPTNYPVGSNPLDVAIGDVDGINGPDLVVGNFGSATVSVLLNNGNGTFGAVTNFNARLKPQGLYLADFDGDGKLDVVAAGNDCSSGNVDFQGCMVFMKGQGNGTFAVPTDQNFTGLDSIPIRRFTENVAPDLDGDGKPDVLFVPLQAGGFGKSVVAVGLNAGDGTGRFRVSYWVGGSPQPTPSANPDFVTGLAAVPADFNGDGVLDLAYAIQGKDNTRGAVSILLGDTPGTFKVPRSYSTFTRNFGGDGGPTARGGAFGDFTSSGKVDLAVLAGGGCPGESPLLDVFPANGDGSLGDPIAATLIPACHGGDSTLRSADLAKNGTLDLLFLGFSFGFGQNRGVVASGNGTGTFTLFSSFSIGQAGEGQGRNMVVGDFNGDGFPDVAVLACNVGQFFNHKSIEIFLQGAGGTKTFTSRSLNEIGLCSGVAGNGSGNGMVAADFDKDGKVDLVAPIFDTNLNRTNALFFKGKGDGTFENPTVIGTGLPPILDYVAADVNNDGNLDLIGIGGSAVWVQLGNGDGTFQPPVAYDFGTSAFGGSCGASILDACEVKVADFDGDGNLDIAVAAPSAFAGFAVLRGKGDGTFELPVKFAVGATGASWLEVADVNGDGLPDVVIGHAGQNGNNYTVLINNSSAPAMAPLKNANSTR